MHNNKFTCLFRQVVRRSSARKVNMSQYRLPQLARYIPLRERAIPKYPIWFRGGPQLRIMMPLFWMKLINREDKMPENQVSFQVHPQMTKYDVKNYLEKIYDVPVDYVTIVKVKGEEVNHPEKGFLLRKEPEKKYANVWLGEGKTFKYPSLFGEKPNPAEKNVEDFQKIQTSLEKERQKTWQMSDLPPWFR